MVKKIKEATKLNLANALSVIRLLLGPVFMYAIFTDRYYGALTIILLATLTDFLDGQIARLMRMQTRLGKMLDPLADKVIIFFAVLTLMIKFEFPLWIGLLVFSRDILLLIISIVFFRKYKNRTLNPHITGKICTFFQMLTVVAYFADAFWLPLGTGIIYTLLGLTVIFTVFSGIMYIIKGYSLFFNKPKVKINLANKITIARILFIPIFIVFLLTEYKYRNIVAAIIFILLALSDALDGYIARKRNQITSFGKLIDPLADKLLVSAALIFLIGQGIDDWMAFLIIAREFAVTGLRTIAMSKNITMQAKFSGKLKTFTQIIAITAVILQIPYSYHMMIIAVIITTYSGIEYFWLARHHLKELG